MAIDPQLVLAELGAVPSWGHLLALGVLVPVTFVALERYFPARDPRPTPPRALRLNAAYWFLNPLAFQVASKLAVLLVCAAACLALGWNVDASLLNGFGPLGSQPLWLQAVEILLLADLIEYWTHRGFHTSRFWRIHAIHHSPEEMTWHSSARAHPVNDFVTRACQVVPLLLVGLSVNAVLVVTPFLFFYVVMLHANVNWDFGPLRWVLVSPRYHRWHHTTEAEGLDKNFAGIFPIWDVLFGTAHFPSREPTRFGVNHDAPPETLLGQLAYPFHRPDAGGA